MIFSQPESFGISYSNVRFMIGDIGWNTLTISEQFT